MRIDALKQEIESAAHTLNDIKTTLNCMSIIKDSLEPRISMLEERIDRFTIRIEEEKNFFNNRNNKKEE